MTYRDPALSGGASPPPPKSPARGLCGWTTSTPALAAEEHFALDGVVLEGAWPGPLDRWIDESNLGKYYFQVLDRATNRVIYSRGFASIYGEWETTDEAKQQRRAFSRERPLSRARRPGAGGDQEARPAQRVPRGVVDGGGSGGRRPWTAARRPS